MGFDVKVKMKRHDLLGLIAFVAGLAGLVLPSGVVILGLLFAAVGIVLGSVSLVMAGAGKSTGKTFAKVGLGFGIVALLVCIGRLQGDKDSRDAPVQPSEVSSWQPKTGKPEGDLQKAKADLRKAKSDLKKAWGDVKSEFQKGLGGEDKVQSGGASDQTVDHSKTNGSPEGSGVTVGEALNDVSSGVLTDERRSQIRDVVETAKLFMTDEQKSNLDAIKTNATGLIKAIDDSMTEKDKRDLMKLKKGMESARKLYKEVKGN